MSVKLDAKTVHDRLTAWLGRTKPSWQGLTVAPMDVVLGSGFSAEIFFVDVEYDEDGQHHRRTLVVRRQPQTFEVVFESDLKLQANMMAALDARGDLPVPSWVGMEDDPSILGAPFLVMGRAEGLTGTLVVLGALAVVLLATALALLMARPLMRLLGTRAEAVVSRMLGVLLAALAAQYVIDGVRAALRL